MAPDRESALHAATDVYNRSSLAEFQLSTGLRYLGDECPVYIANPVRIKALFVDATGQHWCDARLVAESAYRRSTPAGEYFRSEIGGLLNVAHDLWVMTIERGRHDALIAPIAEACRALDLDPPVPFAPGWARSWRTFDWLDDPRGLLLAANDLPSEPGLFERRGLEIGS